MINIKGEKLLVEHEIVISQAQYDKLMSDAAMQIITNLQSDLQITTYVEKKGTSCVSIAYIIPTSINVDSNLFHELEMRHDNFLAAIDKWEPECPKEESEDQNADQNTLEKIAFVKELLNDINLPTEKEDKVVGAMVVKNPVPYLPIVEPWGNVSAALLKEFCEIYLEKYDNNEK